MFDKKEIARDVIALGSWVFYLLVIARMAIKPYRPVLDQVVIAGIVILLIGLIWRKREFNEYISRGVVLVVLTSIFYESLIYTWFVSLVGIGLLWAAWYLDGDWKKIVFGLLIGLIALGIGYYVPGLY
jgi:hypothetical protein